MYALYFNRGFKPIFLNEVIHKIPDKGLAKISVTITEGSLTRTDVVFAGRLSFTVFCRNPKYFSFSDINRLISRIKLSVQPLSSASVSACTRVC